jgi:molybdopterin-guanine dinucleotide biosynthesis protein A
VVVPFNQPSDDPQAFFNANTLAELQSLEGG